LPRRPSPSRGRSRRGSRSGRTCGRRLLPSDTMAARRPRGCSSRTEEGSFPRLHGLRPGDVAGCLRSELLGPRLHIAIARPSSAQPTVESCRRLARGDTKSGGHRCSTPRQACAAEERQRWCGCGSLPALPRDEEGLSHAADAEGRTREAEDNAAARAETPPRRARARTGRSRVRSRVVSQSCRSRRTVLDAERRTLPLHPIWAAFVDGRLNTWPARERARAAGEEARCSESKRKPHVTAQRSLQPALDAGAGDGSHPGSERSASLHGTRARPVSAAGHEVPTRERGGFRPEATGVAEVRWIAGARGKEHRAPTRRPPTEADRAAVNRQVPQPPPARAQALIGGARRKPRTDAGNQRGAGARSRSSGKQKSVGKHRARAPRAVARQRVGGRASPSQTGSSADAGNGSASPRGMRSEGRRGLRAARRAAHAAEALGRTGARANRCKRSTPERHRDGMERDSVRRREASGASG